MRSMLKSLSTAFVTPRRLLHFLVILFGMFAAQVASNAVLVRNQSNYVYPADGDSISIPMMGMMLNHIVMIILLMLAMLSLRTGRAGRVVGYVLLLLICLAYWVQILDWSDVNHYPIGLAQGAVGFLVAGYGYLEFRRVGSST